MSDVAQPLSQCAAMKQARSFKNLLSLKVTLQSEDIITEKVFKSGSKSGLLISLQANINPRDSLLL